jgi:signal transduction histidine kinase
MTAPSGAWLLFDRERRPPVALPVPRQACLGLTRAVLFSVDDPPSLPGVADKVAWRSVWSCLGDAPSVAVCATVWGAGEATPARPLSKWVAESLVLADDVRSGRAAGAGFVTEDDWERYVAAVCPSPIGVGGPLRLDEIGGEVGRTLLAAIRSGSEHPAWREGPPSVAEPALEALVLRDAVLAAVARGAFAGRFDAAVGEARLSAMRELAYGAGHEINNPLANIAARAQALLVEESDPERRRRLATIVDQAFRARDMIGGLMLFARPPKPRPGRVELGRLVEGVIEAARPLANARWIRFEFSPCPTALDAWVDDAHIAEAVRALVVNALEAVDHGGRVAIAVEAAGGDACEIGIVDDGPGMDDETLQRAFDPFFSGREAGRGIGLGLSKAWRLVEVNGGAVTAMSRPGQGTRVTVRLPRSSDGLVAAAR